MPKIIRLLPTIWILFSVYSSCNVLNDDNTEGELKEKINIAQSIITSDNNNHVQTENISFDIKTGLSIQKLTHDGQLRSFLLYIPEDYSSKNKYPLMLNFHGFGGTAENHMKNADMRNLAESNQFILVYPQGTLLGGLPHWNPDPIAEGNKSTTNDLGFVDELIKNLNSNINIDLTRVYACGYSNGGFFSYGLACNLSDKIAAIGSVAGTMIDNTFDSCNFSGPKAMINIHGTDDRIVPYSGTFGLKAIEDVLNFWSNINQAGIVSISENNNYERFEYKNSQGEGLVEHYKIIGGGHYWDDNEKYGGKTTSQIIWDFVSQFNLSGTID